MKTELKKLYEGDIPTVTMLVGALEQVYVFQDQWEKASEILSELNLSQE